jgi:hypothetical protein
MRLNLEEFNGEGGLVEGGGGGGGLIKKGLNLERFNSIEGLIFEQMH